MTCAAVRRAGLAAFTLSLCLAVQPSAADAQSALRLEVPIDCDMASECSIQNYVDTDPGPGAQDHACGALTYDGHRGTDFQVPDFATMRRGVPVLAAADGIVRNIRDGVADGGIEAWERDSDADRALGNAVAIVHGDGWETLYGHMREGSVAVRPGESVRAGQRIGLIGYSGKTAFPHMHFQVVHEDGVVDPFGNAAGTACGEKIPPLWTAAALKRLSYREAILVCGAMAAEVPDQSQTRDRCPPPGSADADVAALTVFAEIAGTREGDLLRLAILFPDGKPLIDNQVRLDSTQARFFRYVGKKRPDGRWPTGSYTGIIELKRFLASPTEPLIAARRSFEIR